MSAHGDDPIALTEATALVNEWFPGNPKNKAKATRLAKILSNFQLCGIRLGYHAVQTELADLYLKCEEKSSRQKAIGLCLMKVSAMHDKARPRIEP